MKKIIFTLVLFLVPSIILANEINNIDMEIYVDNNGTAHVTEEWTTNLTQGTEGYISSCDQRRICMCHGAFRLRKVHTDEYSGLSGHSHRG